MAQHSGTVNKAIIVLNQFLAEPAGLTLTKLAARTGIHKSTILRLCATLEEAGFLERDRRMVYHIGPKVWQLAQVYSQQFHLEEAIRPLLRDLRDRTGESASFYVVDGDERVCLYRENSGHPLRHHLEEGARLPLADGVVGRVLAAFSGAEGTEYDHIRRAGFLIDQGRSPDTASAAVPVFARGGELEGGLVVSGPHTRFDRPARDTALAGLLEAARELQQRMPARQGRRR